MKLDERRTARSSGNSLVVSAPPSIVTFNHSSTCSIGAFPSSVPSSALSSFGNVPLLLRQEFALSTLITSISVSGDDRANHITESTNIAMTARLNALRRDWERLTPLRGDEAVDGTGT